VTYSDAFIKPNFTANLVDIAGRIGELADDAATPAPVQISANLANNGPVTIRGAINPLLAQPVLDLTASAHEVQLTRLSPYSLKYAGYPIVRGRLDADVHYTLTGAKLLASNHFFIDQLTLGDPAPGSPASGLPVRLAIALLKNSRGEIDVNIPVSGSLDNPQFSVGSVIWSALGNFVAKAATAPFSLLAGALRGARPGDMKYVEFAPGSARLSAAARAKLDTLAAALATRPGVRVEIAGRVDPGADEPALRDAWVDRLVLQQQRRDAGADDGSDGGAPAPLSAQDYDKYLMQAWRASDARKDRNLIGIVKTLPAGQMRDVLARSAPVAAASLGALADRRSDAVRQYLAARLDPARIYTVASHPDASGIADAGATTRAELDLR
jgi:hypothetical protein